MSRKEGDEEGGMTNGGVKQVLVGLGLVFAVTLAVVVGKEMSRDAMAVVVGVVCGVAAGIPTSLLLLVVLNRRERGREEEAEQRARQASSVPVVVIQGGGGQVLPSAGQGGYWPMPIPGPQVQRQFHVVGGDDMIVDG
jgi:hypothetical protein